MIAFWQIGSRSNPYALAHMINHPPRSETGRDRSPNVVSCPMDLKSSDIHPLLYPYIPNKYYRQGLMGGSFLNTHCCFHFVLFVVVVDCSKVLLIHFVPIKMLIVIKVTTL